MQKIIITLCLLFLAIGAWAQNDEGAKIVSVSQAIQTNSFTIQVGIPYLGQNSTSRITNPLDVRFPWDVLYLYGSFAEESFDISKGYFGDKILIRWDLRANFDIISNIKIFRRIYNDAGSNTFEYVGSVSKSETSYEDRYVEGGVLYEYKIFADGVSTIETLYSNYIVGVGYRNPTAVVTGNISYKGGNPVKDAIVIASSDGSGINAGGSLNVPANGTVKIEALNTPLTDSLTFQAWLKPENEFTNDAGTAIKLFQLSNLDINTIDVKVNLLATSKILSVNIGGSEYKLHNYFPSGKLNTRGDDILVPVTDFNSSFVHFSVVMTNGDVPLLYINGRVITEAYKTEANSNLAGIDANYTSPYFDVTIPTITNTLSLGGNATNWDDLYIGGGSACYIDEIRIWKDILEPTTIRTDYTRYISGNDSRLITYLSSNEKAGSFAYDLSRNGFDYNKNHGLLWNATTITANKVLWGIGSGNFPTSDQLGILGVTDINGNYEITAIPYSGRGESFNITPLYGQHQFEPSQQLVFLGKGTEVVNKIDFVDISSFSFKGKVLFDSRGVFKSFVDVHLATSAIAVYTDLAEGDEYIDGPGILDEGYNYYEKNGVKYSKGEYWYNDRGTTVDTDDYLERYARIASDGVNVYVDGNIVLDENSVPVVTDTEGNFDISIPIGNHYITLKKSGHGFTYNSRYPAAEATYKEFFEDSNEQVIFIDTTKIILVGRVVGGPVEAQKVIGFGQDSLFQKSIINANGDSETITISSKNNIGVASITLGYKPGGAAVTPYTKFNFNTNIESGEYRVSLLPLNYEIVQSDLIITNNSSISLLDANETLNLSTVDTLSTPEFVYKDGTKELGLPYNNIKSFIYRSVPVLRVINQTSDLELDVDGTKISTDGFLYPVYTQFRLYEIELNSFERYFNYDTDADVEDLVAVIDGELIVTNNLALAGSAVSITDSSDASITMYSFKGGLPSISPPFTRTIDIQYRINGVDYPAENYIKEGILLGGQSDGSQTFVTEAPDDPDIILRDPPGSNSYASITEGESISFTTKSDFSSKVGISENLKLMLGVKFEVGGGLAGPVIETETTDNITLGIGTSITSTDGESLTKTYSFSQTISTSSDIEYVGAEGDLYIGQSKNYFYGSYDDIQVSDEIIGSSPYLELENTLGDIIYVSKQKAMYFAEQPSNTFFIFSQKHILQTLIPDLELIIDNLENGVINESDPGVLTLDQYKEQIRLWRKTILENERSKYLVKNMRPEYKASVSTIIEDFNKEITDAIAKGDLPSEQEAKLEKKLESSNKLKNLLDTKFEDNISLDAGVGEFSRSVETSIIATKSRNINININENLALELGFAFNKMGIISKTSAFFEQDINSNLSEDEASTVTIGYTLKDNDPANLLSVDVVNLFDGNGPVFSTIGGRTSCPYEGAELSYFYNHNAYNDTASIILPLEENKREQLSYATQKAEDPRISVEIASVSNVQEGQKAEFVLRLENGSDLSSDAADFNYFTIIIDNTTNPYNASFNMSQNGTSVQVPYGEPIYYTMTLGKSVSDVYNYDSIRVILQSRCDPVNVFDDIYVSAHFIPSCSEVIVSAPLDNWTYNIEQAYNLDGSTNPLMLKMNGFNTAFNSFQKIDLEYRLGTSPNWTRLHTYYTTQDYYDEAELGSQSEISLIESPELSFAWDIAALNLQDGDYEIRARSTCTNETEFISDVIIGRVDLHTPQRFGTPLPTDGILGPGEDLKVSFNEDIFYNPAVSNIEIKGQTNQLPINHSVSLYFDGQNNTAVINNPRITTDDFTIEFWMNNSTQATTATIIEQTGGLSIKLDDGEISFTLGDVIAKGGIANDNLFHHYTFTYKSSTGEISIYQDDAEIAGNTGTANFPFTNNNSIVIGGNTFIGNIHDLRFWNKTISLENAYADMYYNLIGNEANLIGYWPMNEGRSDIAEDLARFKHAVVNASWDIKPKGTSYDFTEDQYLTLDNVDFVQLTNEMDATISFWVKTGTSQDATLFSNGRGNGTDIVQSNGLSNKWAINITSSGMLTLESEGKSYVLTSQSIADNNWHHISLLFNRIGSLRTYVDAEAVSSNQMTSIGGFSGNRIWLGARGSRNLAGIDSIDNKFKGRIDEFRLWNTLRNVEQISRDRFNEVDVESIGLLLYARMNAPDPETGNGPRYYHAYNNQSVISTNALLSSGTVNYSTDVPPIRPERDLIKFQVNHIINNDEMILEPVISDWASLEGQIIDITVNRMFDNANNMQQSPITWTAYIKRNEVSWFVEGYNEIVDLVKGTDEDKSFEITILNKGGNGQTYTIANAPSWLNLSSTTGTIAPDNQITITATIDLELAPGVYIENLFLQTDFSYDEKMQINLRVLAPEPDWHIDPNDFENSMNIVGKVKIDGKLSLDEYDIVAAFYGNEIRGVSKLVYDDSYQEYFAYLSIYSNTVSGDTIDFKIWDASQGKILEATVNSKMNIPFLVNEVMGTFGQAVIFENSGVIVQQIELNKGWTWISLNVNDLSFSDLNKLTEDLNLETSDLILSTLPSRLESYYKNISIPENSGWSGTISSNGGLSVTKMYKVKFDHEQYLKIRGSIVDLSIWSFQIKKNWNWLPYPLQGNHSTNEALAYFEATEGNVIKSQNLFAIFDPINGWKGTLNYLVSGNGYMIKSSKDQNFEYPNYLFKSSWTESIGVPISSVNNSQNNIQQEFTKYAENMNAIVSIPNGYDELFVYDSRGVLKGMAINQFVNDEKLCFITIYGDTPESLEFHIGDGFHKIATTTTFSFRSNNVLGTIASPIKINIEEFSDNISVFPNPFENNLRINVNVDEDQLIIIKFFSLSGHVLFSKEFNILKGENLLKISPKINAAGVYLMQIEMEKTIIRKRLIKK